MKRINFKSIGIIFLSGLLLAVCILFISATESQNSAVHAASIYNNSIESSNPDSTGYQYKDSALHTLGNFHRVSSEKTYTQAPRLIVTTDIGGDPDDTQSLTRLLVYSNEMDIRGLISSASGTRGELGVDTIKPQLIHKHIDAYSEIYENLLKHDSAFPSPEYLHTLVKKGNPHRGTEYIGKDHDTEGSEWIIQQVDESERMTNISIWGGQTDVIQAIWKVRETRSEKDYQKFISKIRIYDIADQDGIFDYIKSEFPDLFYILSKAPEGVDKREAAFRGMYYGGDESLTSLEWINEHISEGHGPLGALYPQKTWTAPNPHGVMKEGDTPSWFFFLNNDLQDPDHPEWGGWGGRFTAAESDFYRDAKDYAGEEFHPRAGVYRWRPFFQNEFSVRMDWCVKPPEKVNHAPLARVEGFNDSGIIEVAATAGSRLAFKASEDSDPDGDKLTFRWWAYPEASTVERISEIWPYDQSNISFEIPQDEEKGKKIHVILEVSDNGTPSLSSFRRIIVIIV